MAGAMEQHFSPRAWWSTPTLLVEHSGAADFNANLARIILEQEARLRDEAGAAPVAGVERGLTTLWRKYNVLNWPHPECARLAELVLRAARVYFSQFADPDDPDDAIVGIASWANVLRHGESMHVHHHDQAFANAHYFVQTGHDPGVPTGIRDSGHTVYYRPGFFERSHGERQGEVLHPWDADWRISVPPKEGALLFFPGYVRHEVRPHLGPRERISIAFDFYIRRQQPFIYFGGPQWFVPK